MANFFSHLSWFQIILFVVAFTSGILSLIREALLIHNPERINERALFWGCARIAFIVSAVLLWGTEHRNNLLL